MLIKNKNLSLLSDERSEINYSKAGIRGNPK